MGKLKRFEDDESIANGFTENFNRFEDENVFLGNHTHLFEWVWMLLFFLELPF